MIKIRLKFPIKVYREVSEYADKHISHILDEIIDIVISNMDNLPRVVTNLIFNGRPKLPSNLSESDKHSYESCIRTYDNNKYSLACCSGEIILIFIDRLIHDSILAYLESFTEPNNTVDKSKFTAIQYFIYQFALTIIHEFYHITHIENMDLDEFTRFVVEFKTNGICEFSEKYAD